MDGHTFIILAATVGLLALLSLALGVSDYKKYLANVAIIKDAHRLSGKTEGIVVSSKKIYDRLTRAKYDVPVIHYIVGDNIYRLSPRVAAKGVNVRSPDWSVGQEFTVLYDRFKPDFAIAEDFIPVTEFICKNMLSTAKLFLYSAAGLAAFAALVFIWSFFV